MLTNSKNEMGKFKNNWIVQLFGWFSVIALTYLNLIGLPDQIESLFPKNLAYLADGTAILLIVLVIALLIWTIFELYRGNSKSLHITALNHDFTTTFKFVDKPFTSFKTKSSRSDFD